MSLPVADFAAKAKAVKEAQEAIDAAIEAKGVEGSGLSTAAERIADIGEVERVEAVPSGIVWNDYWEEEGKKGTQVWLDVGRYNGGRLKVSVGVQNLKSTVKSVIDWGDGTTTETNANTLYARYNHDYAAAGFYVLTVTDTASRVCFSGACASAGTNGAPVRNSEANDRSSAVAWSVVRVVRMGSSLTSLDSMFQNCEFIGIGGSYAPTFEDSSIFTLGADYSAYDLPPIPPKVTSLYHAFSMLYFYRGRQPELSYLTKVTTCRYAFAGWYSYVKPGERVVLQTLPPNCPDCAGAYYAVGGTTYRGTVDLTSPDSPKSRILIPYDVFPAAATSVGSAFAYARSITCRLPKLSHLVKCADFSALFCDCWMCRGRIPELPDPCVATSVASMFSSCFNLVGDFPKISHLTKCTSMGSMFSNCYRLTGPLPELPPNCREFGSAFYNCYNATGTFPSINPSATGACSNMFYNCRLVRGSLPAIPENTTGISSMFNGCHSATGKFPNLGHLKKVASTGWDSAFAGCSRVTEPPDTFVSLLTPVRFLSMFASSGITSFPFDLSIYPSVTQCQNMFEWCSRLESHSMTFPPNVTNLNYMFQYCPKLNASVPPLAELAPKCTSFYGFMQYCTRVAPLLATDGSVETDADRMYTGKVTSYGSAFYSVSPEAQKQIYDMLVSKGKTGTLWGCVNATWTT